MCKKMIFLAFAFALCLASSGYAATIVWVSDDKEPTGGVPADQAWVDLLEANGYTVNLDFRNIHSMRRKSRLSTPQTLLS